jgi:glutamate-ammonia-ligase adenylyltransferase
VNSFRKEVDKKRKSVRIIFNSIVNEKTEEDETSKRIDEINFENSKKAKNDLKFLRKGKGLISDKQFDKKSIDAFKKIESHLIKYLVDSILPDKVLSNFVRIIRYAEFPSIWYREFLDGQFFVYFLTICEYSQRSVDLFAEDKELREFFLSREIFKRNKKEIESENELKSVLFQLGVLITLKMTTPIDASEIISNYVIMELNRLTEEFAQNKSWQNGFIVAAMGSTGSGEMTFGSDIDLVFAIKDTAKHPDAQSEFQTLLKITREKLFLYTVDCRLRPEGESSQLVWDLDEYKKYFITRVRVWEALSFLKIKFVAGNKDIYRSFINSIVSSIKKIPLEKVSSEITEIRKLVSKSFSSSVNLIDIKKGYGCLSDVEFTIYYLLLNNPTLINKCTGKSLLFSCDILIDEDVNITNVKLLRKNYTFLKEVQIFNQLAFATNSSKLSVDNISDLLFPSIFKLKNDEEFRKKLNSITEQNSKIYRKYLKPYK